MSREAIQKALDDAGVSFDSVEAANVGYVFGDSTKGQRAVYEMGRTGIPVVNCNNNCATGSTALYLSRQLIAGNLARCALALGFEKMQKGALGLDGQGDVNPLDKHVDGMTELGGDRGKAPVAPWMFALAGQQHSKQYGTTKEQFAKVAYKNHKHSVNNPYAQFQDEYTLEEILGSKLIFEPLTKLQCSPTSDGAAAAILANEEFVKEHKLEDKAVEIIGMGLATDVENMLLDPISLVGFGMAQMAATKAYTQAGIKATDAQVVELHDCFSTNELLTYEALGLCSEGEGGKLVDEGDNTYGGRWVINPSGGLISKGHPLGASGIAQCAELNWQLRGLAGKRQVDGAKVAIQHNLGLGGAAVVTVYQKYGS
ncbi:sterol carrier protein 2-like [Dysidea avara]|uniref:sterol carrier protein 2-like n=1 Tax=Dysidea avara TaxID=196820 RepID=UPI00331F0671